METTPSTDPSRSPRSISRRFAELGQVLAGLRPGRTREDEVFIFDSTGTALQDVAAAALVYERAVASGRGMRFSFAA